MGRPVSWVVRDAVTLYIDAAEATGLRPPQLGQEAVQRRKEIPPACKILFEAYWVNAAGGGYEGGSWPSKGTAMTGWAASWVCCARR